MLAGRTRSEGHGHNLTEITIRLPYIEESWDDFIQWNPESSQTLGQAIAERCAREKWALAKHAAFVTHFLGCFLKEQEWIEAGMGFETPPPTDETNGGQRLVVQGRGPTLAIQQRFAESKRIEDANPHWSYVRVAQELSKIPGYEDVTEGDVRND
jgi:hypothetical protein